MKVEGIFKELGVRRKIQEIRKIKENGERGTKIWVKLKSQEQKRKVLEKKQTER